MRLPGFLFGFAVLLWFTVTQARAEQIAIREPDGVVLHAELFRPATGIPAAPSVVALHGCGGAYPSRDRQWTELLTRTGHAVLFPDSFGSRGLGPQCHVHDRIRGYMAKRREDVLAAAQWLAAQDWTPKGGVVLLGWSNGASTVLRAGQVASDLPAGLLRGLVALYPGCSFAAHSAQWHPAAPLLILIGDSDDWTPAAPCQELAMHVRTGVTLVTYPGAYHDFDVSRSVRVLHGMAYSQNADGSVHAGGDPKARADTLARVPAFIASLSPATP
ncbi:MAG TPA: prolyl oligopeptidase family serine peptidase [Acetobacteraceae bacterium]